MFRLRFCSEVNYFLGQPNTSAGSYNMGLSAVNAEPDPLISIRRNRSASQMYPTGGRHFRGSSMGGVGPGESGETGSSSFHAGLLKISRVFMKMPFDTFQTIHFIANNLGTGLLYQFLTVCEGVNLGLI